MPDMSRSSTRTIEAKQVLRTSSDDHQAEVLIAPPLAVGLSERLSSFILDERPAIFAEASQAVYEPNGAAAAILGDLIKPVALASLYNCLPPLLGGGTAELDRLLVDWSTAGLIDVIPDAGGLLEPADRQAGLPLGYEVASVFGHGRSLEWFDALNYLPEAGNGELSAHVWSYKGVGIVKFANQPARIILRDQIAAALRYSLVEMILQHTDRIAMHCACMTVGDGAILLLGAPGSGKSTLAMFANECGMTLAGDDIALFDPLSGKIMPLALPLTLKEGSWSLLTATSWRHSNTAPVQRQDGVTVMYLPLRGPVSQTPMKIRALIRIDRGAQERATISHWSKTDCLRHVCSEAKKNSGNASVEDINAMVSAISDAKTLTLSYSDAAEAGQLLGLNFGG
ncbi:hypothetical protein [Allopontixanthobacter sediminis]|uniref:Hpr(Ser) kinase/phosphatase n=1 Tax=Allopontixanthobacter sediminis TaxID=1689985 RepID=A0A845AZQ8_9SPHN|nr:hypothetical protein [Allopontixanthobacter sediminis]MXP44973.1 hypothetical protein [Allopontixanthobacter sediminis]